jgi:hypothetical protein
MPFLLDKEDVFLLPTNEREEEEVEEEEEEIISRAAKLWEESLFIIIYTLRTCARASKENEENEGKKEKR